VRLGFWIIAAAVVLLDQWTKHLVIASMPLHHSFPVVPGLLYLSHERNTGVAFGQLREAGPLLIVAACVAVAAILIYRARLLRNGPALHPMLSLGLALPLGGAVGNLIDRVRFGYVVDFLDLRWWPIFNVADSAITVGAACLVLFFAFVHRPEEEGLGSVDGRELTQMNANSERSL
jgi:signal peptidase II